MTGEEEIIVTRLLVICFLLIGVNNIWADDAALSIKAEVWADNWFSFYSADKFIFEDHVPITTERSFNAETFTFTSDYPLVLNFVLKDFKENDTGLEYIGSQRQQMGDGGFIAQFTDRKSGEVIDVTDGHWRCRVIHKAPLDKACRDERNPLAGEAPCTFFTEAEPGNWKSPDFDDAEWEKASVHSGGDIGPKGGFYDIAWYSAARFIWSDDIEADNTVLCRLMIKSAEDRPHFSNELATLRQPAVPAKTAPINATSPLRVEGKRKPPPPPPPGERPKLRRPD